MAAGSINISNIEFDAVKSDIKIYLAGQNEFRDFDFEGSAMSTLIDVMAYTSHYMGVHSHMSFNEMFLDTAKLRSSVVSNAKSIGYTPRSIQSATATINLSITPAVNPGTPISIPQGTEFTSNVSNVNYIFTVLTSTTLVDDVVTGTYTGDVVVSQGKLLTTEWTYNVNSTSQKFVLTDPNVDASSISLKVQYNSSGGAINTWSRASSIIAVTKTDRSFFVQENSTGRSEIYFGDDIVGQKPVNNNLITASYIVTDGSVANNISVFALSGSVSSYASNEFTITTVNPSSGGSDKETEESIRITAPLNYAAQNRAVVVNDYEAIIKSQYGFIESLSIWGGEDAVPAQYGKVFLSVKPTYGNTISPTKKAEMITFLKGYNVVGITPQFVDADFVYVTVTTSSEYYESQTNQSVSTIKSKIETAITDYFASNTVAFKSDLIYSALMNAIDSADVSIKGNLTSIGLSKTHLPQAGTKETTILDFSNVLKIRSIITDSWTYLSDTYYIADDGIGNLHEYKNGIKSVFIVGSVDYTTGVVTYSSYAIPITTNATVTTRCVPAENNIKSARNTLIRIDGTPTVTVTGIK